MTRSSRHSHRYSRDHGGSAPRERVTTEVVNHEAAGDGVATAGEEPRCWDVESAVAAVRRGSAPVGGLARSASSATTIRVPPDRCCGTARCSAMSQPFT